MLKSSAHIDFCWLRNRWWKMTRCRRRNHHRNGALQLTLKSSAHLDYFWLRNRWRNWVVADP
jgi:hypothetical protein